MHSLERKEPEIKMGKVEQACQRYNLGKTNMRKIAEEAGAVVRIGKSYLINFTVMDAYMDNMTE